MKKYIQITGGRGPVECARAVTLVAREVYKSLGAFNVSLADCEPHNQFDDCFMSMTFSIESISIPESIIKDWEGTIQWTATKNPYRPNHKRKNWFVGVSFFDEVDLPEIRDADICFESCRSGGKGGQNVNKVETAIRATHIPTGISVKCTEERSQLQNKNKAKERLLLKLHQQNQITADTTKNEKWSRHDSLQRGNPIKKFTGPL